MRASLLAMSRISTETVEYIAGLARLSLDADDIEKMVADMDRMLDYVETLSGLDTRDIAPTAHAIALDTPVREDEPRSDMDLELALSNAPERVGTAFSVPKVLDGDENG